MKTNALRIATSLILCLVVLTLGSTVCAQEEMTGQYQELENLENENLGYFTRIYRIAEDYPEFEYKYVYRDGELEEVMVKNVEDEMDRKRLEVLIYDYKKNKEKMKNVPTRTGVYYSVDQGAEPVEGYREYFRKLYDNIQYPEDAKEWGAEGNVYVKFVVDTEGKIGYITTTEDIETTQERFVEDLKTAAKEAVKATSGNWNPAMADGEPVASWVVLPVVFRVEPYPFMTTMIM